VRITIIAVGRLKERFWTDACSEYLKRLRPYADVRVVEIADRDPSRLGEQRALAEEGEDVVRALPDSAHVIVLDVAGTVSSSEAFSAHLSELGLAGRSAVAFVVGGSHGVSPTVLARADERLSFGPMTLPHNLARVVLLEQVYRAFRIARNEPYHK
jgi:23S rRNA (pseudouridine1915-N3)-methyltransferase